MKAFLKYITVVGSLSLSVLFAFLWGLQVCNASTAPNTVLFFQSQESLESSHGTILKIYTLDESPVTLQSLSENTDEMIRLFHLPTGKISEGSGKSIIEIPYRPYDIQLVEITEAEKVQQLPFQLIPLKEKPHLGNLLWGHFISTTSLLLLAVLIAVFMIFHLQGVSFEGGTFIKWGILCFLIILWIHSFLQPTLLNAYDEDLITLNGTSPQISQEDPVSLTTRSLTKLLPSGALVPDIAVSWSNISPRVWEFTIDEGFDATRIVELLQDKTQELGIRQMLSTIKELVATPNNRIQCILLQSDPLLAQKFSQIALYVDESTLLNTDKEALVMKSGGTKTRIISENREQQKQRIVTEESLQLLEPHPALWPLLSINNYSITPQINSESLFLITKRTAGPFVDPLLIEKLRQDLQSGAVLQTGYLQYAQLASQFAAPGIVGYSPELALAFMKATEEGNIPVELETNESVSESISSVVFRYPSQERALGGVVIDLLSSYGYEVLGEPYDDDQEALVLSQGDFDLLLVSYDFVLGDAGPFLDLFVDSNASVNTWYKNDEVDQLISASRRELNQSKRNDMLKQIMLNITLEKPLGIPLLYKRSFKATKVEENSLLERLAIWYLSL